MDDKSTLVVNLFAGPGTGKSTNAALLFGKLKVAGYNAELVHEFAKDLVWEKRHAALTDQQYIMAKQTWHVRRLLGQVEIIVTDSPILLGLVYKGDAYTNHLGKHLFNTFSGWNTLNIFLERDAEHHPYNEAGRGQSEDEATNLDQRIKAMLEDFAIPHINVPILGGEDTANRLVELTEETYA